MVVRKDSNVERLGEMAALPADISPLQIGTRGELNGQPFELIGRVRVIWEQGSWTEWYALFSNGSVGWVAETQGFFMVTTTAGVTEELPVYSNQYRVGNSIELGKRSWKIVDVKQVTCLGGEGELPFAAPPGTKRANADLSGTGRMCGTIEFDEEGPEVFFGEYAEFEQLKFTNLRPVPGWNAEPDQVRHQTIALNCPSCGGVVDLRAPGFTQAAVCGSCGTLIDTTNQSFKLLQRADNKVREAIQKATAVIPIGARGTLFGVEWEVIGFQLRADKYSKWTEYLLFNPWHGFRWLVNFGGHWSFIWRLLGEPDLVIKQRVHHDDVRYDLFARDKAQVRVVVGEFYWKVERGEVAHVSDFVQPPHILSWETYPELNEHTWSQGEYIEPRVVQEAFKLEKVPGRDGIYLNQPNPWAQRWKGIRGLALFFLTAFIVIQIFSAVSGERQPLWRGSFVFDRAAATKVAVTPPFKITKQQPLAIDISAAVDNSWIGFDAELVNAQTNEAFPVEIGVEYHHGYEDGESWREGAQDSEVTIPAVLPGEYFINFEAEADAALQRMDYDVTIKPGGLFWSNFWLGLLLLCTYPLFVLWRRHAWEVERWSESDFSPYSSSE